MHVLITGHTGFKGAWLVLLHNALGNKVSGLALDPVRHSLFERARIAELMEVDARVDIRDASATATSIASIAPDVVIHMAAQPLVRESYVDPRGTIETNVIGTLNILEGISAAPAVQAALIVTTDKVYRNVGKLQGYVEDDPLGGHDPYSASKAMTDVLSMSWALSFQGASLGIARAGNVIGGGDVSQDRLFPDLMRAFSANEIAGVRAPESVRPWQHVLDCLYGYYLLSNHLLTSNSRGEPWNFGPEPDSFRTVGEAASVAGTCWGANASWERVWSEGPHEASILTLNSEKARLGLDWSDQLKFAEAVAWTVEWSKRAAAGDDPRDITMSQIHDYLNRIAQ